LGQSWANSLLLHSITPFSYQDWIEDWPSIGALTPTHPADAHTLSFSLTHPHTHTHTHTHNTHIHIQVAPPVLIPRPETEELVEWVLQAAVEWGQEGRGGGGGGKGGLCFLDVGCGTGAIGLALLKARGGNTLSNDREGPHSCACWCGQGVAHTTRACV
jgi:hypothetical protein